jgi:hypothetical protein
MKAVLDLDDCDLELARFEVLRLRNLFPRLGLCTIRHSSEESHHLYFEGEITQDEFENVLVACWLEHYGHRTFTLLCGDGTLRVSKKPVSKIDEPYTVEVL